MMYRFFTNDVGLNQYSAYADSVRGLSLQHCEARARRLAAKLGCKVLLLPHDRKDLWPDKKTGRIPVEAKAFVFEAEGK
jgi:hypothetical protein